ncbi:MAG TPA: glycerophosphodiester phosphodiesterase [Burkholderiaceae bacterium]
MPTPLPLPPWPYPRWIAHRGAGRLAPENTLAAFARGAGHGYRMFECDVKLAADGTPFLLHDDTLDRTTSGRGSAGALPWAALAELDAGSWHSAAHAGERLPTLAQLARFCRDGGHAVNLEIKPVPGTAAHTGAVVAQTAAALWQDALPPPLLSSFQRDALAAARDAAPTLPRALLLDTLPDDWLDAARSLGCQGVIAHFSLWTADHMAQAQAAGLRTLSYTVNDDAVAQRLLQWGIDGIITDRVDHFAPQS